MARAVVVALLATGLVAAPAPGFAVVPETRLDTVRPHLVDRPASQDADGPRAAAAGDRRWARATGTPPFVLVGLSWRGAEDAAVNLRVRSGGDWSAWWSLAHVPADADGGAHGAAHAGEGHSPVEGHLGEHAPDPGRTDAGDRSDRVFTDPVWVGEADGWELDAPPGVTDVEVHLARDGERRVEVRDRTRPAGAAARRPAIHTRGQWDARPPKESPSYGKVRIAAIHHTVSSNEYSSNDVPGMIRAIQAFHMDGRGWDDIGYNFLIDRFGRVWEGRDGGADRSVIGAHAAGYNSRSTGISLLGTFHPHVDGRSEARPSAAAIEATTALLAWKLPHHGSDPARSSTFECCWRTETDPETGEKRTTSRTVTQPNVIGHRDVSQTSCPGNHLYRRIPDLRREASRRAVAVQAYAPGFRGGVHLAAGDLVDGDDDGVDEIITGADVGGGPHVRAFRPGGAALGGFFAYDPAFRGGVRVATADVDGDGTDEIVTAPGPGGGPHVTVRELDGSVLRSFYAYDRGFSGGVSVAAADVDGAPGVELVTAPGPGGGPHVTVRRPDGMLVASFHAFERDFRGGLRVAAADVTGDSRTEVLVASGPGRVAEVRIFRMGTLGLGRVAHIGTIRPYGTFTGGTWVAAGPAGAGRDGLVVTGAGDGGGPHVRTFRGDGTPVESFFAYDPSDATGARIAVGAFEEADVRQIAAAPGAGGLPVVRVLDLQGRLVPL